MEPRTRWVEKFGKHGKFDAYDGVSPDGQMLEPFVDRAAYDLLQNENAAFEGKIDHLEALVEKLKLAIDKVHAVANSDAFVAVFQIAQVHNMPYNGEQFGKELADAKQALSEHGYS